MTLTDLQTAVWGLNPYQIEQVSSQVAKYLKLNEELKQTRSTVCPVCGTVDARFIKKGLQAGKQRYQCKECGSKFTYDTKQLTAHSHQPIDSWITMIEDTLSLKPMDETAEKISVCHETSFNMRHKLLAFMEIMPVRMTLQPSGGLCFIRNPGHPVINISTKNSRNGFHPGRICAILKFGWFNLSIQRLYGL